MIGAGPERRPQSVIWTSAGAIPGPSGEPRSDGYSIFDTFERMQTTTRVLITTATDLDPDGAALTRFQRSLTR